MQLDNAFCRNAYVDGRSLNHSYFGAILDTLKLTQHLYKKEDLAQLYHYLASLFEEDNFDWAGDAPFAPEKVLTTPEKSGKLSNKKGQRNNRPLIDVIQPQESCSGDGGHLNMQEASQQEDLTEADVANP